MAKSVLHTTIGMCKICASLYTRNFTRLFTYPRTYTYINRFLAKARLQRCTRARLMLTLRRRLGPQSLLCSHSFPLVGRLRSIQILAGACLVCVAGRVIWLILQRLLHQHLYGIHPMDPARGACGRYHCCGSEGL